MGNQEILDYIVQHINTNFGASIGVVTSDTKLITSRLLDSINTLQMISHFEEHFKFEAQAHEVTPDNLDTPALMADYIGRKLVE